MKPSTRARKEKLNTLSMEAAMGRLKLKASIKMGRLTGMTQDYSQKQWGLLCYELDTFNRKHIIRYVEWSNALLSGTGTLDRYDMDRTFLSRAYFIRAIDMAVRGVNEVWTQKEALAHMEGLTDLELAAAEAGQLDLDFPDLPPMP